MNYLQALHTLGYSSNNTPGYYRRLAMAKYTTITLKTPLKIKVALKVVAFG